MNELTERKEDLCQRCEEHADLIRGVLTELARRDNDQINHHCQALTEADGPAYSTMTLQQLGALLRNGASQLSWPALVYEARFKDGRYAQLIHSALYPLGES